MPRPGQRSRRRPRETSCSACRGRGEPRAIRRREPAHASLALRPAVRHANASTSKPFSRAARPANRKRVAAPAGHAVSLGGAICGERQKSLSTDCGATCTLRAPRALHVGADVRAVGDDRVGGAVEARERQVAERVRGAARVRPQRGPEDQRDAGAARARPGGEQREPPAGGADDSAIVAAGGQRRELARAHAPVGERQLAGVVRRRRAWSARRTARPRSPPARAAARARPRGRRARAR